MDGAEPAEVRDVARDLAGRNWFVGVFAGLFLLEFGQLIRPHSWPWTIVHLLGIGLAFAVLAFGLRLAETLWLQPFTWRIHPLVPGGLIAATSLVVASVGVPLGVYLLLIRVAWKRRATWHLAADRTHFVAPASPYRTGPWAIALGWAAAGGVLTERVPDQDRMRVAPPQAGET